MAYTLDLSLALGPGKTGLSDLRAQLVDTSGSDVGSAISTGFVEIGTSGNYLWHYAAFPDAHRGGVKFYSAAASSVILLFAAINPEEAERVDAAVSTRSSHTAADVWAVATRVLTAGTNLSIPSASDIATAVWASGTRTLTSFGTLVADIWANVTRTLTSGGGASAADVWGYASRTLTQTAAAVTASVSGSDLAIVRAVTFEATLTGLNIPATWSAIYFTVKKYRAVADTDAVVQVLESNPSGAGDGLLRINRAAGTLAQGSLVVDQALGTIGIVLADDATTLLVGGAYVYDAKALLSDGTSVLLTAANATVADTVTETI